MYDLCFRDHGKPKTCFPVHLGISPPEATEAAYVRDEEEEIRRNRETVRVTFNIPAWITHSGILKMSSEISKIHFTFWMVGYRFNF